MAKSAHEIEVLSPCQYYTFIFLVSLYWFNPGLWAGKHGDALHRELIPLDLSRCYMSSTFPALLVWGTVWQFLGFLPPAPLPYDTQPLAILFTVAFKVFELLCNRYNSGMIQICIISVGSSWFLQWIHFSGYLCFFIIGFSKIFLGRNLVLRSCGTQKKSQLHSPSIEVIRFCKKGLKQDENGSANLSGFLVFHHKVLW